MPKIVLPDTNGGYNISTINDNFQAIAAELNDKVLYRDNPVGEVNSLQTDIDVNGKRIYNLPAPSLPSEAARLQDVVNGVAGIVPASFIPFSPSGDIASTNVQEAIVELNTELAATSGAGKVGFLSSLTYAANTVGKWLKDLSTAAGSTLIGFIQPETGAVLRTVSDKLRERVSVFDFGAVGDGITDDFPAIQAAVDSLPMGGTVFIPDTAASYRITRYILVPSNVTVIGAGKGTAIKRDFINGFAFLALSATNVRIADLRITSTIPSVANPSGGVGFQECTYCTCENVDITGMRQFGVWLYDSSYCLVRGNSFSGWIGAYQQDAADISILNNANYNLVEGNNCFGGGDHGISVQDTYAGAKPTGNRIINNVVGAHTAYGILVYVTNNFNTLTLVDGNTVRDIIGSSLLGASGAGIYIQSAGGSVVTNNTITNCCIATTDFFILAPAGIGVTTPPGVPSWPIIVSDNNVDSVRGPGIAVISTGGPVSVRGNAVTLVCADATANPVSIYVSNAPRTNVSENIINHTSPANAIDIVSRSGIVFNDVSVINNTIDTSSLGISINRIDTATFENVRVIGNYVKGATVRAALVRRVSGLVFTNNILNSPGLVLEIQFATGSMISNNGFYGPSGANGVVFANSCTDSVFSESNVLSTRMENNDASGVVVSRFGSAPPAVGSWSVGDRIIQSIPVVGNPKGWRCTVSGSPGAWVSEGNL